MKRESIECIVIEQAAIAANLDPEMITITSTIDDLAMDSMSVINFVVGVEDAFDVEISCADRICMDRLTDVCDLVSNKVVMEMPVAA